jgi:hypothetical protein
MQEYLSDSATQLSYQQGLLHVRRQPDFHAREQRAHAEQVASCCHVHYAEGLHGVLAGPVQAAKLGQVNSLAVEELGTSSFCVSAGTELLQARHELPQSSAFVSEAELFFLKPRIRVSWMHGLSFNSCPQIIWHRFAAPHAGQQAHKLLSRGCLLEPASAFKPSNVGDAIRK